MFGIDNLFYREPRLLILTVAIILVGGLSAYSVLPRAEDPALTKRFATIETPFPGANAERVEALVTEKIEDALREIEEIKEIKSFSNSNLSFISVELEDSIRAVDEVWSRVRDKVAEIEPQLPAGADKPVVEAQDITAYTVLASISWQQDSPPNYAIMRRIADDLADELRGLSGTAEVDLFGDPDEEVRVAVESQTLASLGLTVEDVARAIAQGDAKAPAGTLNTARGDLLVEVSGEVETLDRVMSIPVRAGDAQQVIRVSDIADVRKTITNPPTDIALVDGQPAVTVAARAKNAIRVDQWAALARGVIDDFSERVTTGLKLELIFDQSQYVSRRLDGLANNLLMAMGLVILVVLAMMGWRSAIAVGVALPLASLMVLLGMRAMGIPMHQMSVTGLIVALGLLIDNAIVIVDEVRQRTAKGMAPAAAIASAVQHLAVPLFGSTLTTALAFMPLVLMPGGAGEFVGTIGMSVILAISSSLFLALTVIPAIAGLINERHTDTRSGWLQQGVYSPGLARAYRATLDSLLRHPWAGVVCSLVLPIAGFVAAGSLPEQFFPQADRDQIQIEMMLPSYASLENTEGLVQKASEIITAHPDVARVHWFLGTSAPKFYYNMLENRNNAPFYAQALVQLHSAKDDSRVVREVQQRLDEALPAAQMVVRQLEQGPPFDAPVELRLTGPDLDRLRTLGEEVRTVLSETPNTVHTRATLVDGRPKLQLSLDDAEARVAGLDNAGIAVALRENLTGATGGSMLEATEELPVRVRLVEAQRHGVADLPSINLLTTAAAPNASRAAGQAGIVPVAALGKLELLPEISAIPHYNGQRSNTVQAFVTAGVLPSTVLNDALARLRTSDFQLPAGYQLSIAGESAERDTAVGNLMASVSLLMVMMVATLVLTFRSFRAAGMLAVSATLAMGLGMAALYVFGYPFGFMAIVGTMGLVGVAMNDSIVVLAAIRDDADARAGNPVAIRTVVENTTRHVLSTTATTVVGFLPLLLAGGGFWPPLAVAIGGGVLGATILALVLIPTSYVLLFCRETRPQRADAAETVSVAGDWAVVPE